MTCFFLCFIVLDALHLTITCGYISCYGHSYNKLLITCISPSVCVCLNWVLIIDFFPVNTDRYWAALYEFHFETLVPRKKLNISRLSERPDANLHTFPMCQHLLFRDKRFHFTCLDKWLEHTIRRDLINHTSPADKLIATQIKANKSKNRLVENIFIISTK